MPTLKLSEPAALKSKIFPRVMTYAEALEYQGIIHLADFSNSPQRGVLDELLTGLSCADSTTLSEGFRLQNAVDGAAGHLAGVSRRTR